MDFDAHLLQYTAPCRHQLVRTQVRVRFVMPAAGQTGPQRRFQLTDSFTVTSFCSYTNCSMMRFPDSQSDMGRTWRNTNKQPRRSHSQSMRSCSINSSHS